MSARNNPNLIVATPPEFGGSPGVWSPEQLLVASVESCLLSTFLFFSRRFELAFGTYSSTATGTMEKTSQGFRFAAIDVSIAITVPDVNAAKKASSLRLKEKMEKYCPVSASLDCPVRLVFEIASETEKQGDDTNA